MESNVKRERLRASCIRVATCLVASVLTAPSPRVLLAKGLRKRELLFIGHGLFLPHSSHWRAECRRAALVISAFEALSLYFIDRGYRGAKVAGAAFLFLWAFDLLGGRRRVLRQSR